MRTYRALVVEDDDRIIDQIDDTLFSLGHQYERATNQADAQQKLESEFLDYILLDLHIPARPGRGGASAEFGLHLLRTIRQMKGPAAMPVIIMTGQGAACVDLVSELNRFGPNEYISKPWPEKGRTLATVIKEVLNAHAQETETPKPVPGAKKSKFAGGTLVYRPGRVELLGRVVTEESHRGNFWAVLKCLKQKTPDGRFRGFSGKALAEKFKGGVATQTPQRRAWATFAGGLRNCWATPASRPARMTSFSAADRDIALGNGSPSRIGTEMTRRQLRGQMCHVPASKSPMSPRRRQMSLCHIASTGFSIIFAVAKNSSAPTSKNSSRSQRRQPSVTFRTCSNVA